MLKLLFYNNVLGPSFVTHVKRQKLNFINSGRGYNNNCVLYPRTWVDEVNFAVLYASRMTGLHAVIKQQFFTFITPISTNWNSDWEWSGPSCITPSLWQPFVSDLIAYQAISVRHCRWWTFWAPSLTFVIVIIWSWFFVAAIDDVSSYALFIGLFFHLSVLGLRRSNNSDLFILQGQVQHWLGEADIRSINSFPVHSRCCWPKIIAMLANLLMLYLYTVHTVEQIVRWAICWQLCFSLNNNLKSSLWWSFHVV